MQNHDHNLNNYFLFLSYPGNKQKEQAQKIGGFYSLEIKVDF